MNEERSAKERSSASEVLRSLPPGPSGPLGRLLLALPLVAIAAGLAWFWRDAPHTRKLHLRFGAGAPSLSAVELTCQDAHGLESGARWAFTHDAPREVTHTTSTTEAELECRITLDVPTGPRVVTRRIQFDSEEARLQLENELR